MRFQEHHFRNLGRARDHLTETIISLRSAVDRMTGDDWIDASQLLLEIVAHLAHMLEKGGIVHAVEYYLGSATDQWPGGEGAW